MAEVLKQDQAAQTGFAASFAGAAKFNIWLDHTGFLPAIAASVCRRRRLASKWSFLDERIVQLHLSGLLDEPPEDGSDGLRVERRHETDWS